MHSATSSSAACSKTCSHYEGRPGHEIAFVFEADLADPTLYERDEIEGQESDGIHFSAKWTRLSHFAPGGQPLYPEGLYEMLAAGHGSSA